MSSVFYTMLSLGSDSTLFPMLAVCLRASIDVTCYCGKILCIETKGRYLWFMLME